MKTKFYILYVFIAATSLMYSQVRLGGGGTPVRIEATSAAFIDGSSNHIDLTMEGDINQGRGIVFPYTDLTQMSNLGDERPRSE